MVDRTAEFNFMHPTWGIRRSGAPTWVVVLMVPLGGFLASFMTEVGKDVYHALKQLAGKIFAETQQDEPKYPCRIELRDLQSGLALHLDATEFPDNAYRQLFTIRLPVLPAGYRLKRLVWYEAGIPEFGEGWILIVEAPVTRLSRSPWSFGGGQYLIRRHPLWLV